ncbi:MAG: hypothetical protein D6791_17110, partial [Chloroflexi bacterium]
MDAGWDWVLRADTQNLGDWEKFTLLYQGNNQVAFKTYHSRYVTAMDAGWDWVLRAETQELGDWEKFTLVDAEAGTELSCSEVCQRLLQQGEATVALRTYHGRYVTAMEAGWVLRADAQSLSDQG